LLWGGGGGGCATLSDIGYLWLHFSVSDTDCSTVLSHFERRELVQVLEGYICICSCYNRIQVNHAAILHELSYSHRKIA